MQAVRRHGQRHVKCPRKPRILTASPEYSVLGFWGIVSAPVGCRALLKQLKLSVEIQYYSSSLLPTFGRKRAALRLARVGLEYAE